MVCDMTDPEIYAGHSQEVRRGSVVVASLLLLRTPGYGYGLVAPALARVERVGVDGGARRARGRRGPRAPHRGRHLRRTPGGGPGSASVVVGGT